MQSLKEIEAWYENPDPWGYTTNPADARRKKRLLDIIDKFGPYKRALDIGAGEGFITKDLPAKEIHAIELSDKAASRFPENIKRVHEPDGKYDLIICTGVLYKHYDWGKFTDWIKQAASGIVVTCNIADWEIIDLPFKKQMYSQEFPYREYRQRLRVYKWDK